MIEHRAIKTTYYKLIRILLVSFFLIILTLTFNKTTALAATNVDTYAELKAACEAGGTVNVTSPITVTNAITITKNVTLTCSHDAGSRKQDVVRDKEYHNHIFDIKNGATLTLRCCVSGNGKASDDDANFRGYGGDGKEESGYYGWALIKLTDGDLVMDSDKSVLKNNYNPTTIDKSVWTYNGTKYHAFVSLFTNVSQDGLGGSAIYALHGSFTMSDGKIYNCVADSGPALYFASGYKSNQAKISGGSIYDNVARRFGGAIFSLNRENNKITTNAVASNGYNFTSTRKLNSDGSNARLTISGGTLRNNISRLGGGAIWSGHGATLYISGGTIRNNICTESNGGAIRTNAGDISSIASTGILCMGLPGGQTWIAGGKIYDNESATGGGGIAAARIDLSEAEDYNEDIYYDNLFKVTGGEIYNNQAGAEGGGITTATETYINGGKFYGNLALENGGGIYGNTKAYLEMTSGSIYSNKADGDGGGIYLVTGGDECYITGGSIYENEATNGGGVASNRRNGLHIEDVKIYDNIVSNYGGGLYSKNLCYITGGYFYGNNPSGVHAANGTLSIQGGRYGFKTYPDGSSYTASVNTVSQIVVGSSAECEFIDLYKPRIITGLEDDEGVTDNYGLRNYGTVTIPATDGQVYFFGKGTSIYNEGTLKINGELKIYTSPKAGETTLQQRRGIHNASGGTVTVNSSDFEVKYCGERGIYNQGTFTFKKGSIHHNTSPSVTSDYGGGVYNTGTSATFTMSGGNIYENKADRGAGIYNTSKASVIISNGKIYNNTANKTGGGIQNSATLEMTGSTIYDNTAGTYGGGVYCASDSTGTITGGEIKTNNAARGGGVGNNGETNLGGSVKIHDHIVNEYGGGAYNGGSGTLTISGGTIYNNKANISGGGVHILSGGAGVISGGTISYNEVSTTYNENGATSYGGGIANNGTLTVTGGEIHNNTATINNIPGDAPDNALLINVGHGGGIYSSKDMTIENASIHLNTADVGGGIYVTSSGQTIVKKNVSVYNNTADYGGGICNIGTWTEENSLTTETSLAIYNNKATINGGGIDNRGTLLSYYVNIYSNEASTTGAGVVSTGNTTLNKAAIYNNTAINGGGGGICSSTNGTLNLNDSIVYSNTANAGAGLYLLKSSKLSTISNCRIYENTTKTYGGGIYTLSKVDLNSTLIHSNTATEAGGLGGGAFINGENAIVNMSQSEIYNNISSSNGGGVYIYDKGTFRMNDGSIHGNTSNNNGNGIYIRPTGIFDMTGGSVFSNISNKNKWGIYVCNNSTFKMSNTAIVENDNVVYLETGSFITVPTEFTEDKNIRAYVTGANMVTGRVIAKYSDNADAKGTKALYWNTDAIQENEQYFVVEGKLLRAGNQGAATVSETINKQDIFLSEVYSVDFDMNPSISMLFSTITHTIGEKEYVFDDLMNNTINRNVYQKYWNEELSFDPGRAASNSAVVSGWKLSDDRTIQFTPDENNVITATINKNIVILAEWASQIDVDYDGNDATDGENWTENKVDINEDYQVSDDNTAFTRQETTAEGEKRLFKFTGWSFEEGAIAKDYAFGATIAADELRAYVMDMEGRERAVATIYAVWDEFPTIEATDRWFTLDEAQNGKITLEELMSKANAIDGVVGDTTDFTKDLKGSEEFTLINFNEEDFKAFTTTGNVTVTYKAVDKVGNETYKTVVIHIVDKDEQKYDETTLFTRFISSNYFKDADGNFVAPEYGGLNEKSKWRTDSDYNSLLTSTLSNTKDTASGNWTEIKEIWIWSIDEIQLCKNFVATHGVGNVENPNALNNFYNQFGPESEE